MNFVLVFFLALISFSFLVPLIIGTAFITVDWTDYLSNQIDIIVGKCSDVFQAKYDADSDGLGEIARFFSNIIFWIIYLLGVILKVLILITHTLPSHIGQMFNNSIVWRFINWVKRIFKRVRTRRQVLGAPPRATFHDDAPIDLNRDALDDHDGPPEDEEETDEFQKGIEDDIASRKAGKSSSQPPIAPPPSGINRK